MISENYEENDYNLVVDLLTISYYCNYVFCVLGEQASPKRATVQNPIRLYNHLPWHTLTSVMSLPLLYPRTFGTIMLSLHPSPCCHISFSYTTSFNTKVNYQRIQTTNSHAPCYHHRHDCNVDFVLFYNVTCYTNSLFNPAYVATL